MTVPRTSRQTSSFEDTVRRKQGLAAGAGRFLAQLGDGGSASPFGIDEDIVSHYLNVILLQATARRVYATPGAHIEAPVVVRASENETIKVTVDKWEVLMRTCGFHGVQSALPVADEAPPHPSLKDASISPSAKSSTAHTRIRAIPMCTLRLVAFECGVDTCRDTSSG